MDIPSISVIVTTYKRFKAVQRAIKSVINQSCKPNEIIVIEDSSDSGIGKWIGEYYSEITYIKNKENLGLAGSRNVGIHRSNSDWIAFLDDDDEWTPERLEEQVQCYQNLKPVEKERLACIQAGVKKINIDGIVTGIQLPLNDANLKESIMKCGASTPSSSFLFHKKALVEVGGFDETLVSGIDHDIWMKLAVAGYKTKALKKPLVIVRDEPIDTMMANTEKRLKGITQYVEKWTPTYIEWFGEKKGLMYGKQYYTQVIGRLAGEKLANHQLKEFLTAFKTIWYFTDKQIISMLAATKKVIKIYILAKIPFLKSFIQRKNIKRHRTV